MMSYRTNLDELVEIADDTLLDGDLIGSPVWLALKTTGITSVTNFGFAGAIIHDLNGFHALTE